VPHLSNVLILVYNRIDLLSKTRFRVDIPTLTRRFDRTTKHVFRRDDEPLHIQFASHRERDQALNIRGGRITLDG
jgi:hypothetical protein